MRWAATALLVGVAWAWAGMETPAATDPGDVDLVGHVGALVVFTLPPGAVVAAVAGRFGNRSTGARIVTWLATAAVAAWLALMTAGLAVWPGDLFYCGSEGDPCETGAGHRIVVGAAGVAVAGACALIERASAPS